VWGRTNAHYYSLQMPSLKEYTKTGKR